MLKNSRQPKVRPANYYTITAVRSRLYSIYRSLMSDGIEVLDLFAGVGKISLDSINIEHIKYIVFVDRDRAAVRSITTRMLKHNVKYKVVICDTLKFQFQKSFNVIFIDPPFGLNLIMKTISHILHTPMIDPMKGALIIIKASKDEELQLDLFPEIQNIHITEQKSLNIYFIEVFQNIC